MKKYIFWLFLISIPCLMLDSQSLSVDTNITVSNILLIIAFLMAIANGVLARPVRSGRHAKTNVLSIFLPAVMFLSGFVTIIWANRPDIVIRQLVTLIGCVIVLFLTQYVAVNAFSIKKISKYYIFGGFICAILGIVQSVLATYYDVHVGQVTNSLGRKIVAISRASSTWNDPNIFALFLIPVIPLAIVLIKKIFLKAMIIGIVGFGIALSYSRTAWIALATEIMILATLYALFLPKRYYVKKMVYISLIILGIFVLIFSGISIRNQVWDPLVNINSGSFYARLEMSRYAWKIFIDSGYMGIGPGNLFPTTTYFTHNALLSISVEYGILGFFAWITFILYAVILSFKNIIKNRSSGLWDMNIAVIAIIGGLLVGSLAIEIQLVKFLWLFLALAFAMNSATACNFRRISENKRVLAGSKCSMKLPLES